MADGKKVLIFGCGGFVGKYLTDEFTSNGYEVTGSDIRVPEWADDQFISCDLLSAEVVKAVISKVMPDIIVNLAAISSVGQSWKNPQLTISVNVIGSLNILQAVKDCSAEGKAPKVMFIGSSEEYAPASAPVSETSPLDSNSPYGISKMTQESFAALYGKEFGIDVYLVRAFNHTGVGQADNFVLPSWCKQVAEIDKSGKPGVMNVGNLKVRRDFSDVRDIVRAYRLIVEKGQPGKAYNVGSGVAHSLEDMLKAITSLSSQEITINVDPARIRPTDTPVICCDNSLIRSELGWAPEHDIFDTLKEMYENYRK
jgi:GDP-4-dehydro-6-deoxy-D-mannose reductase